ncbi:MAG TPA: class I SAM-dependent methyltransferase [Gemmatimonadales bacterium]|nr:class I SAM-dependent methyltransferase [Gemmatimonadales bacterium]
MSAACRLCGAAAPRAVRRIPSHQTGDPYTLYACGACRSELFDPAEHDVDIAALYDAEEVPREYATFRRQRYWADEVRRLERLHGATVRSVLDVGCRTGDFLLHWPADRRRVGVELSERAAAVATARGLDVVRRPIEAYQPDRPFDVVTPYAVLEHLVDPLAMLARLPALLESGGILAILVPTHQSVKSRLLSRVGRRWHMYNPPLHLSFLSHELLDRLLAGHGLQLVERRWTSGGMVNPFRRVPVASGAWSRLMHLVDTRSPVRRVALFDHLYSYYRRGAG